jgi:hypothetical protein
MAKGKVAFRTPSDDSCKRKRRGLVLARGEKC